MKKLRRNFCYLSGLLILCVAKAIWYVEGKLGNIRAKLFLKGSFLKHQKTWTTELVMEVCDGKIVSARVARSQ